MPVDDTMTDGEILSLMLSSSDVEQWNSRRELVKGYLRSTEWVSANIDASGLIGKTKIA